MIKLIIKLYQHYPKKMNKKTIIVTGGLGTIGLALARFVEARTYSNCRRYQKNKIRNHDDNFFF